MKSSRNLGTAALLVILILPGAGVQAQDVKPGEKNQPEEKWNVQKEYDEHGNLIYCDSTYSRTWKHFEFPDVHAGDPFDNLDFSFSHTLHRFRFFEHSPDSAWMDFFLPFGDHLPPDHFFFNPRPFQDPEGLFKKHRERMEKLWQELKFPDDSMFHADPKWQQWPRMQKSPSRVIGI